MTRPGPIVAFTPPSEIGPETVLIGANCLDAAHAAPPSGPVRMIRPYQDHASIARASNYCWEVALQACSRLGERLGEIHGVRQDPVYWEALLLPWMAAWVENLYDRYLRLREVRDTLPGARLRMPRVAPPGVLYRRSADVWGHSYLHLGNARIYSLLIDAMGLAATVELFDANLDGAAKRGETRARAFKALILRQARSLLHRDPFAQAGLDWTEPHVDSLKDEGFAPRNVDRRRLSLDAPAGDEFERLLGALMPQALPSSLFEEFAARSAYVERLRQRQRLKTLCISQVIWMNDSLKYLVAAFKASGQRVVGRQHGAGYGCYELVTPERVERRLSDFFISWGWDDDRLCPVIPLPDPMLSALADRHRRSTDDIYFIGSHGPMYMFRYQSYWIPEFVYSRYGSMQEAFFQHLPTPVRADLVYRPSRAEFGWNERSRVNRAVPGIRMDDSAKAINGMKRSKLVVIDHPGTPLLQALAMNAPTVAFWDDAQCPMRPEAEPYFELLRKAGILHAGPEKAARHVNAVAQDPSGWWESVPVQKARALFCRRFAWADPKWKAVWSRTLARYERRES